MEKRPVSLTVIAVILIILAALGLVGMAMMGSNPVMMKAVEQMHVPLMFLQAWSVIGAIVTAICAYGILKGLPWSRVLYVVWGVIGLVFNAYTSPMKIGVVLGLVILVVISVFLWTNAANDWFQARGLMLSREGRRG
jgi:uncharacterized membrane protein (DUF2068 family)